IGSVMNRNLSITLTSNNFPIPMSSNRLGWLNSCNSNASVSNLKRQYNEQGYLWIKGLLNRNQVMSLRSLFFEKCKALALLKEGNSSEEMIVPASEIPIAAMNKVRADFANSIEYQSLVHSQEILNFLGDLLEGSVCSLKRQIVRYTIPNESKSDTGAHYDFIYLRCGTTNLLSTWIPIGDIPVEMGGVMYLENSLSLGHKMEEKFNAEIADLSDKKRYSVRSKGMGLDGWITRDLSAVSELTNSKWLVADYEAGDIVIHSPYIIHASSTNQDLKQRIRLSTDIRYQRVDAEVDRRWDKAWHPDDGL
ncbi:MAG: phytanoyl-CoA dioxygenase family protein, partial [Waterburya sp.]